MQPPEYTDGCLELFDIVTDETNDFPTEYLKDTNMKIWYKEISVFDHLKFELGKDNIEVTLKIRIPKYKGINSKCICKIDGEYHSIFNATHIRNKDGFEETEITLKKPEKTYEVMKDDQE